jgi:hypothetical protein
MLSSPVSSYCFFISFPFIFFFCSSFSIRTMSPLMGPDGLEEELDIFSEYTEKSSQELFKHAKLSTGNINGRLFEAGESVERYSARVCVYVIKSKS